MSSLDFTSAALASSRVSFHLFFELIDRLNLGMRLSEFKFHLWCLACVKEEWGVLSGRVNLVVELEFSEGK